MPAGPAETPVPGGDEDLAGSTPASQLPWQAIPRFVPGTTNVQDYTKKMRFLAAMWPQEHLHLLAPRAAMMVEGSAFSLVSRLDGEKLKTNSTAGVALLVKTIGGQWGATDLEERYEYFEKALYGTTQKHDESNDSFISRMESHFSELIARHTSLEEVQAYVLLRQSAIPPDDKKKILLEHSGQLSYGPVVKSLRLIGSKFFHEFQSGKASTRNKVYDALLAEEPDASPDEPSVEKQILFAGYDEEAELDPEYVEALAAQEDADALIIQSFENEFEEFIQETAEMHLALTTYVEARQRLLDQGILASQRFWEERIQDRQGTSSLWWWWQGRSKWALSPHSPEQMQDMWSKGPLACRVSQQRDCLSLDDAQSSRCSQCRSHRG